MRWTTGKRIFVALTLATLVILALNAVGTRWSFQRGFADYLSGQETERLSVVVEGLADFYGRENSWERLASNPRLWDELIRGEDAPRRPPPRRGAEPGGRPGPPGVRPPDDPFGLHARLTLVDSDNVIIFGHDVREARVRRLEIHFQGQRVGALLLRPQTELTEAVDLNFAAEQFRSSIYIGIVMLLLAAVLAGVITRQIVRPLRSLTSGARALTAGEFEKRITVTRDDEFGDLARDFNILAETLQSNKSVRRQWVSDISHELRTPLAILSGELQAIKDGVRTFDEGTQLSLQAEVERLQKLVSDLHEITVSDEGGLQYVHETIDVVSLLRDVINANASRFEDAGLGIRFDAVSGELLVTGDSSRLDQLFTNLLENSIRYTDSPGMVEINAEATSQHITIVVADSAPGVWESQHERLFDRLYRVDSSRNRATGGSGLGLSVCESIVTAHSGKITAGPSALGGVAFEIILPRASDVIE